MDKSLKSFMIDEKADLRQAMKQLEATERKILFVVDHQSRLFGTLTDGDIRRWILGGGGLQEKIAKICNRKPCSFKHNYNLELLKKEMLAKNIMSIPIVNDRGEVVEIIFWENVFACDIAKKHEASIDIPVVIMAGGKGTRLDPFTKVLPKPLIPIGDKTVIEIIIDCFLGYGVRRFYITVNHKQKIIKSYFEELDPPYSIEYLEEKIPLGTAGGLKALADGIGNTFLVTNCDVIIKADYAELVNHHLANSNDITLVASVKNYNIPYGICEIHNGGGLAKIVEKPEYSFLVNTGMYVINVTALRQIPDNEQFHMTQLIEKVKEAGGKVGVFPISEDMWFDTGEWIEYRKAVEKFQV